MVKAIKMTKKFLAMLLMASILLSTAVTATAAEAEKTALSNLMKSASVSSLTGNARRAWMVALASLGMTVISPKKKGVEESENDDERMKGKNDEIKRMQN